MNGPSKMELGILQTKTKLLEVVNYVMAMTNQYKKACSVLARLLAAQKRPLSVESEETRTALIAEPSAHYLSKAQDLMVVIVATEMMKKVQKLSGYMDQVAMAEAYENKQAAKDKPNIYVYDYVHSSHYKKLRPDE